MELFLEKADGFIKRAFCIVIILFAICCVIGNFTVSKGTDSQIENKPIFIGCSTEVSTSETTETEPIAKHLGEFRITVYTPYCDGGKWGYQTATGAKSESLRTCAVDPSVIPLGTTIMVDGICLKAVDTGSAVKGKVIDIFYDGTVEEAKEWLANVGTVHEVYEVV